MKVNKYSDSINIQFESDDLYIAVEVEGVDEETDTLDYVIIDCESFNLDEFDKAVECYLRMKKEHPDESVIFKIVSKTREHSVFFHVGNVNFVGVKVSTMSIESDIIEKFGRIREILECK